MTPEKFQIEYRRIGLLATSIGNERIRVDTSGRVFHSRNRAECHEGSQWCDDWEDVGELDRSQIEALWQAIDQTGILSVENAQIATDVEGGRREELEISYDGKNMVIVVQNIDCYELEELIRYLYDMIYMLGTTQE